MSEVNLAQSRERFAGAIRAIWWLTLIRGILLILIGIVALFNPAMTLVALAQVIGFYLILEGCLAIWAGISGQTSSRVWTIIRGLLLILAGVFVVAHPVIMAAINATILIYLLAIAFLISGVTEIYVAIRDRKQIEGEGWLILGGVLSIIFAFVLIVAPLAAATMFVRILGVFAIIAGITLIATAFRLRNFGSNIRK